MYEQQHGGRVGRCLVCGTYEPIRAMGGPYNGRAALVQHPPGPDLVPPCPFHRWKHLVAVGDTALCSCTRDHAAPPLPTQ
jgi:hypothetical protein